MAQIPHLIIKYLLLKIQIYQNLNSKFYLLQYFWRILGTCIFETRTLPLTFSAWLLIVLLSSGWCAHENKWTEDPHFVESPSYRSMQRFTGITKLTLYITYKFEPNTQLWNAAVKPWTCGHLGLCATCATYYTHTLSYLLRASASWQVSEDNQLRVSHRLDELIPIRVYYCPSSTNGHAIYQELWKEKGVVYLISKQYILVSLITNLLTCVVMKIGGLQWSWNYRILVLKINWDIQEVKSRTPAKTEAWWAPVCTGCKPGRVALWVIGTGTGQSAQLVLLILQSSRCRQAVCVTYDTEDIWKCAAWTQRLYM